MKQLRRRWLGSLAGICCLWAVLLVLLSGPTWAGFDEGVAAWERGDYAVALRELRPLAEKGHATAQLIVGAVYTSGEGVPKDYREAVKWFRRSAEQGNAGAQFSLGLMYFEGHGVPKNYKEAVKWYRLAAEQGESGAQFSLGLMYAKGQGVTRDFVQAHLWFSLAEAQGVDNGRKERALVAGQMTPAQIAEAQRLAREWRPRPKTSSGPDRSHVNR